MINIQKVVDITDYKVLLIKDLIMFTSIFIIFIVLRKLFI